MFGGRDEYKWHGKSTNLAAFPIFFRGNFIFLMCITRIDRLFAHTELHPSKELVYLLALFLKLIIKCKRKLEFLGQNDSSSLSPNLCTQVTKARICDPGRDVSY